MKKIPTLFHRVFEGHKIVDITPEVKPELQWVLEGEGIATVKYDGACCAIIDGIFYKRFDAKAGRKIPEGAIPCCDPDPVTGHHPHWVPVSENNPSDKWFLEAKGKKGKDDYLYGTYEAVGLHFNGNPYGLDFDCLVRHGASFIAVDRSFDGIRQFLEQHYIEGLVFWKDGEPQCKIKRSDFGLPWGKKGKR